jgi:hypothetical protein
MKSRLPKSLLQKYGLAVAGVWGVWLAISVLLYLLILGPQGRLMATLQQTMQTATEDHELAQKAHRPETKLHIQERMEKATQNLNQFMIGADAASKLTVLISQLAAQQSLADFSVKTRELPPTFDDPKKSGITEAWLELTFSGPFNQCAAYINALERNKPVIFIESAEIQRNAQTTENPTVRLLISYLIDTNPMEFTVSTQSPQPEKSINTEDAAPSQDISVK